jgi:putative redox protein
VRRGLLTRRRLASEAFVIKHYSNDDVTVVWKPDLCRHTGICAHGLPLVFDPRRRPWVQLEHADTETIKAQVERCPSGALSWIKKEDKGE